MRVCQRGHELKPENTYVRPNGKRTCKTCKQAYAREYYQRNPEKRKASERAYRHQNQGRVLSRHNPAQANGARAQGDYHTQEERRLSVLESNRKAALEFKTNKRVSRVAEDIWWELIPEIERKLRAH